LVQGRQDSECSFGGTEVCRGLLFENFQPTYRIDGQDGQEYRPTHCHHELEGVGDDDPPEAGEDAVERGDPEQ
jgi:hypothetical protein